MTKKELEFRDGEKFRMIKATEIRPDNIIRFRAEGPAFKVNTCSVVGNDLRMNLTELTSNKKTGLAIVLDSHVYLITNYEN